jgi:DNA-binding GntR family transcriptional regulator
MVRLLDEPVNGEALTNARHAVWNRQFHGLIHRCARSLEARAAAEMYWDRSDFMIASTRPPFWRMNLERAHDEHIALLDAVADGDVTAAQQLAFSHIRSFGDAVVEHLLAAGDAGDELGQMSQRPPRER